MVNKWTELSQNANCSFTRDLGNRYPYWLSPFGNARYFWPWRPIQVSPIGLSRVLSSRSIDVIVSELGWIWVPSLTLIVAAHLWRRREARLVRNDPTAD